MNLELVPLDRKEERQVINLYPRDPWSVERVRHETSKVVGETKIPANVRIAQPYQIPSP